MGWLQNILEADKDLFLWLNSFYSGFWDTVMLMVTRKETWVPFYLVVIFYFVRYYKSKSLLVIVVLAVMILTSDQLSVLIKDATVRFRPVHDPVIGPLVHNILRKGSLYGFVSSHAANSFAIFAFTSLIFKNRWFTLLIILWALLFSYSRIYAGMHYPLDIICGAVLGWLVGIGFYKILMFTDNHYFNKRSPQIQITHLKNSDAAVIIVVFTVLLSTVVITASVLHKYGYLQ